MSYNITYILLGTQVVSAPFTPRDATKGAEKQNLHLDSCNSELGAYLQISQVGIWVSIYSLLIDMELINVK